MRSFKIYGKWSVQTNKHTHTHAQCSHASVGLAHAHPNKGGNKIFKVGPFWLNASGGIQICRVGPILAENMVRGTIFFSRNFGPRTNFSRTKIPVTGLVNESRAAIEVLGGY